MLGEARPGADLADLVLNASRFFPCVNQHLSDFISHVANPWKLVAIWQAILGYSP